MKAKARLKQKLMPFMLMLLAYACPLPVMAASSPQLSPQQQQIAEQIHKNLRCPVCTSQSIADSQNEISQQMRSEVGRMLASGKSESEIYQYFSERYGNFVLMNPPKSGINWLLWLSPVLALGAGGLLLAGFLRRSPSLSSTSPSGAEEDHSHRDELDPYQIQVQQDIERLKQQEPKA